MSEIYYLCYKDKKLGPPMNKVSAEAMLLKMSRCFKDLKIVATEEETEMLHKSG